MKRTFLTFITFFAVTAARASDLVTTYHFDPGLRREANPFVSVLGGGWSILLLSNILLTALLLGILLCFYWRCAPASMTAVPASVREYFGLQLFGRILAVSEVLRFAIVGFPFPKNRTQFLRCIGFISCWMIVFGSILATFSWWAIHEWKWTEYQRINWVFSYRGYPLGQASLCVVFCYLAAIAYFRMEFNSFRRQFKSR